MKESSGPRVAGRSHTAVCHVAALISRSVMATRGIHHPRVRRPAAAAAAVAGGGGGRWWRRRRGGGGGGDQGTVVALPVGPGH